jgi:hypothetical protein
MLDLSEMVLAGPTHSDNTEDLLPGVSKEATTEDGSSPSSRRPA